MTSISDFSDTPKYTIKNVSVQTGIRPITLRAWERRYNVLSPHRSENRYRLYSDRDVAVLNWLKGRVNSGISISAAVAELRSMIQNGSWPDAVPTALPQRSEEPAAPPAEYARKLYEYLVRHDEAAASELLRDVLPIFDLRTILVEVITPCLIAIGDAWYRGEIRITTEHFASALLRGKLLAMLQSYPVRRGAPSILIGGAPTEQHEIGPLMMAILLRSEGYQVEFLGPDLPLEDLVEYARFEKPALVVLTATTRPAALELKRMQEKVNRLRPAPLFGYGGLAFNLDSELRKQTPGIFLGENMDLALQTIGVLLKSSQTNQPIQERAS